MDLDDRLGGAEERLALLERQLADPAVLASRERYEQVVREHAHQSALVAALHDWRGHRADLEAARAMLAEADGESRDWLRGEVARLQTRLDQIEAELRTLLLPPDPRDERNVIVEIRAGTGGEEAALFAADLARLYARYAERRGWTIEVMDANPTEIGGYKELVFGVQGRGAYSRLKYESGVHRVQRVPETESSGRIHTSTATVAVLPEADEVEVDIRPEDLDIDTYRSGGAGGQHVNKTESAIRIVHRPTGIVVTCQDERSQHKNRARAMTILRARIFERLQSEQHHEIASERRAQVGSGERSERIRTYNFPQNRVTDERINLTLYKLRQVMDGDLDELVDALIAKDQAARLDRSAEAAQGLV
jgi:peptide chain release factor 1